MVENKAELFVFVNSDKYEAMSIVDGWMYDLGLAAEEININKPWGAYWRISKGQVGRFVELFFPEIVEDFSGAELNLRPKFLLVAPGARLSWQYHERRSELWNVVFGKVGVVTSEDDVEREERVIGKGERVVLEEGVRHRLNGKDSWGLVAEIWTHTDPDYPSDEEDIVRLQDDYARV